MIPTGKILKRIARRNEVRKELVDFCGGKCLICGLVDHPIAYDFHHVNSSEKTISISSACRRLMAKTEGIWDKVHKCVLLCAICHRKVESGLLPMKFKRDSSGKWSLDNSHTIP